jgi:hypothetical protein
MTAVMTGKAASEPRSFFQDERCTGDAADGIEPTFGSGSVISSSFDQVMRA